MTQFTTVSAPGKLFLFGEYAVLAQGLCIVTSTNRRLVAFEHQGDSYKFDGQPTIGELPPLVRAVIDEQGLRAEDANRWGTDTSAFFRGDAKLGLGSSAASTAALTSLARHQHNRPFNPKSLFRDAMRAHLALQGGRGSGADVASACYGGTLAFRRQTPQDPFVGLDMGQDTMVNPMFQGEDLAWVGPLHWPDGLRVVPVWTGQPAHSVSLIKQVEAAREAQPDAVHEIFTRIHAIALEAYRAFYMDDAAKIVALAKQGDEAMDALGQLTGAPIVTPLHERLRKHCASFGVTTKPSGAGGGDFSLIFGTDDAPWDEIIGGLPVEIEFLDIDVHTYGTVRH